MIGQTFQVHAYTVTVFLPFALHEPGTRKKTLLCHRQIQNPKLSSAIACIVFCVLLCMCCIYVQGINILTHLQ